MTLDEKGTAKWQRPLPPITLSYFKIAAWTASVYVFSLESQSEPEVCDRDPDRNQM